MQRRVAVRGIIVHDNKLLCVRLKPYNNVMAGTYWCVPGGGLDPGEPLLAGLERELLEETGVKPKLGSLLYIQQFQHKDTEQLELFFLVLNSKDYTQIDLAATSHGMTEIEEIAFIDPRQHTVLPAFLGKENPSKIQPNQVTKIFTYL